MFGLARFGADPFAAILSYFGVTPATLDRAIAQSDAADSMSPTSFATGSLMQNSGISSLMSGDSRTIQIISGSFGVASIDSDG